LTRGGGDRGPDYHTGIHPAELLPDLLLPLI
jgi:hypothetical protein